MDPDLVLVTGYTTLTDLLTPDNKPAPDPAAYWASGVADTLSNMSAPGRKVVAIGMQPRASKEPLQCLGGPSATLQDCSYPVDALSLEVNRAERAAADRTGAEFVEWSAWVCYENLCPMVVEKVATIYDNHHMTATFSATLADEMTSELRRFMQ